MKLRAWGSWLGMAAACGGAASPASKPPPLPATAPPAAMPPGESARLFAGGQGTCRLRASGRLDCWGKVPNGLEALLQEVRPQQAAFFGPYDPRPYCALNDEGTATCRAACGQTPDCLGNRHVIHNVKRVERMNDSIALVRDDGTLCVLAEGEPNCGAARLFERDDGFSDPAPLELVNLTRAWALRHGFELPGKIYCGLDKLEGHDEFVCQKHEPDGASTAAVADDFSLREDGTVWGPAGSSDEVDALLVRRPKDARLPGFEHVDELWANDWLVCSRSRSGNVACIERTTRGGAWAPGDGRVPHAVPPLTCAKQMVSGDQHVCAQSCDDRSYCWGNNDYGQLGQPPSAATSHTFELPRVTQLAAGGRKTCALLSGGKVMCWGHSSYYQLGAPLPRTALAVPLAVPLPGPARQIACGESTACALLDDGRVSCWGRNNLRARGSGVPKQLPPHLIEDVSGASQVATEDRAACAVVKGEVRCWGSNSAGLRGLGHKLEVSEAASTVPGLRDVVDLDLGSSFACAVSSDGRVRCWGWLSGNREPAAPTEVAGITDAVDVTCGDDGYCVRTKSGAGLCTEKSGQPPTLRWPAEVVRIVAPIGSVYDNMCAVLRDGSTLCTGQLAVFDLPPLVRGLKSPQSLALGDGHACAIIGVGRVTCVGTNHVGQLGTGHLLASSIPILVP